MRIELKKTANILKEEGYYDMFMFITANERIPSEDEIEEYIEDEELEKDEKGLPIVDDDDDEIELSEEELEELDDEIFDKESRKVLCLKENKLKYLPYVITARNEKKIVAKEIRKHIREILADILDDEQISDIEQFDTVVEMDENWEVVCPCCGDIETFPVRCEDGIQYALCNECGVEFAVIDEPVAEIKEVIIPIDEFAEVAIEDDGKVANWKLVVEGQVIEEGKEFPCEHDVNSPCSANCAADCFIREHQYDHFVDFDEVKDIFVTEYKDEFEPEELEEGIDVLKENYDVNYKELFMSATTKAVKAANKLYYETYIARSNVFEIGEQFYKTDGTLATIIGKDENDYMIEDDEGTFIENGKSVNEKVSHGEYLFANNKETKIDDIEENDEFINDEGYYKVESRSRNNIYYTWNPYNEVLTAAESLGMATVSEFFEIVEGCVRN